MHQSVNHCWTVKIPLSPSEHWWLATGAIPTFCWAPSVDFKHCWSAPVFIIYMTCLNGKKVKMPKRKSASQTCIYRNWAIWCHIWNKKWKHSHTGQTLTFCGNKNKREKKRNLFKMKSYILRQIYINASKWIIMTKNMRFHLHYHFHRLLRYFFIHASDNKGNASGDRLIFI